MFDEDLLPICFDTTEEGEILLFLDSQKVVCVREPKNEGKEKENGHHIKRPLNAFMIWCNYQRKKLLEDSPRLASVNRILGEKWNSMSAEEKQPFVEEQVKLAKLHKELFPNYKYKPRPRKVYYVDGKKMTIGKFKALVKQRAKEMMQLTSENLRKLPDMAFGYVPRDMLLPNTKCQSSA